MAQQTFHKYHGLGNDFVLIDGLAAAPAQWASSADAALRLCDRRRGVGADGLILIQPAEGGASRARMVVINADGSRPQMCGNGLRCVARYLHENPDSPLRGQESFIVETDAGPRQCEIQHPRAGDLLVRVDMGSASLERDSLPMKGTGHFIDQKIELPDGRLSGTAVSMGNPHWVCFVNRDDLEPLARQFGPQVERHEWFPQRTNVEIARLLGPDEIQVWVWERGVGITQACGTGACATAAAAVVTQRCPADTPIGVHLPGGPLEITVESESLRVWMTGPATSVYRGTILRDQIRPSVLR